MRTSQMILAALAGLLGADSSRAALPQPALVWVCPGGLICSSVGAQSIEATPGWWRSDRLELSHKLETPGVAGMPFAAAVAGDTLWLEFVGDPGLGAGGTSTYARIIVRLSAKRFRDGAIEWKDWAHEKEFLPKGPEALSVHMFGQWDKSITFQRNTVAVPGEKDPRAVAWSHPIPTGPNRCIRFVLGKSTAGDDAKASILILERVEGGKRQTERDPPPSSVACPFEEAFHAIAVGRSYYFLTASGDMYRSELGKDDAPGKIERMAFEKQGKVVGLATDTRTDRAFAFVSSADKSIRYTRVGTDSKWATDSKWTAVGEKVTPERFATPTEAARTMADLLRKDRQILLWD